MSQVFRKQRVNKRLEGKACGHCGDALELGVEGIICEICDTPHHARCWDEKMGCGGPPECPNIPLPAIEGGPERPLRDDERVCPYCAKVIYREAEVCRHCDQIVSTDGVYRGEKSTSAQAKIALLSAIFGLLSCVTLLTSLLTLVLGPLAVVCGLRARREIGSNVRLRGGGLAMAGMILGSLDVLICFASISSLPPGSMEALTYRVAYWSGYCCIPFFFIVVLFFLLGRRK